MVGVLTQRLEVRPPLPGDRQRFVALFQDPAFMVFADGSALDEVEAGTRFDRMLHRAELSPISKRPVVERRTLR